MLEIGDADDSWLARLERAVRREKKARGDLFELVREAEGGAAIDRPEPEPTTADSVTVGAAEHVRVCCPECDAEFSAEGRELPWIEIECTSCGEAMLGVDLVLASGGVWVIDGHAGCNARSFRLIDAKGETFYAAFCACRRDWHGPRRETDEEAVADARAHRLGLEDGASTGHKDRSQAS